MSKFLVLGSNSNAGSYFIKWCIENGQEVMATSRSVVNSPWYLAYDSTQVRTLQIDLNKDLEFLRKELCKFRPKYVINYVSQSMVAESWDSPQDWIRTNVTSTQLLLDVLRDCDFLEKYIHFSTPEVYGNITGEVSEDVIFNPSTPYAATRATGDFFVKMWTKRYNLPGIITRAGNVYGATQKLYRIIPKSVYYFLNSLKIPLHGGGHTRRNFVHSHDVAVATYLLCTEGKIGDTYHISHNEYVSIRELVELIAERVGVSFEEMVEVTEDRPGKDLNYSLGFEKLKKLGWAPTVSLKDGVDEVIRWYEKNSQHLKLKDSVYEHKR
jgi:dTDP-glucose 4,6-dehydratase